MDDRDTTGRDAEACAVPRHRLSSTDLEGPGKIAALRELYGRELMRAELIATAQDDAVAFEATVASLDGVAWARCRAASVDFARTRELVQDGSDDLLLSTTTEGYTLHVGGREMVVPAGGAVLASNARAYRVCNHRPGVTTGIQLPRAGLARLIPRLGEAPFLPLPAGTPGIDLVFGYARLITEARGMTPALIEKASAHLIELIASVIEPGRDAGPASVAEARLDAVKREVRAQAALPGLTLERFARLHGVTPRYVQRLFEREGDSFSDFLRRERLERARRMLCDPAKPGRRVLAIALECGFGDITTFNRAFRRAFGHTPTEARRQGGG